MSPSAPAPGHSLRIVQVPGKGRGILAGTAFGPGEVVDTAPVVVVPARQRTSVEETELGRFCFVWDDRTGSLAFALGRGSLINHSYDPNVVTEKKVAARLIVFVARRRIEAGEELTINYNGEPSNREPVGFRVHDLSGSGWDDVEPA